MTEFFTALFSALKEILLTRKIFRISYYVAPVSLLLLIIPDKWLEITRFLNNRDQYIEWIEIIWFVSFLVAIIGIVSSGITWVENKYITKQENKKKIKILESLTPQECAFLADNFFKHNQISTNLYRNDPVAGSFEKKGFAFISSDVRSEHMIGYTLETWIYELIMSNPNIILDKTIQDEEGYYKQKKQSM